MAIGETRYITSNTSLNSKYEMTKNDDTLIISGVTVTLLSPSGEIFTNEGDDIVLIEGSTITTDEPNLKFYLGSGNDRLTLKDSTLSVDVSLYEGDDTVVIAGPQQSITKLNKKLQFGNGNDTLELISILENSGIIDFGNSGIKTIRFNGGMLAGDGTVGTFSNLEVTISGGTLGENLILSGEETSITLNGNLLGATNEEQIIISNSSITLTVGDKVRTNVHLNLDGVILNQTVGETIEFSDISDYAITANNTIAHFHGIAVQGAGAFIGSGLDLTINNSDFSNSNKQTAIVLNDGSKLTGAYLSFSGNQGYGALLLDNVSANISDFRVNSNRNEKAASSIAVETDTGVEVKTDHVFVGASGGAIHKNEGNITLTSASFSGNLVSASASAYVCANTFAFAFKAANAYAVATTTPLTYAYADASESAIKSESGSATATATASAYGGAIYQNGGSLYLSEASFLRNVASASASASALANPTAYAHAQANAYAMGSRYISKSQVGYNSAYASAYVWTQATAYASAEAYASAYACGGAIYQNGGSLQLTNASFSGNIASASASASASISTFVSASAFAQALSSSNSRFVSLSGTSDIFTSTYYVREIARGSNSYASSEAAAYASALADVATYAYATACGGAIYQNGGTLNLSNASFSGNIASASASSSNFAYGGAIYLTNTIANFEDTVFCNNKAIASSYNCGGAIYLNQTTLNYTVTSGKNISNTGNQAKDGGWLFVDNQSTVNISVGDNGCLTIGDMTDNDDIAGSSDSRIVKDGIGKILINSDISNYNGFWTITAGILELGRLSRNINLSNWTIGTNALLILSEENDTINLSTNKKIGTIDVGGGDDTINTNGYDLTDGIILFSDLTIGGGGRISTSLKNRSETEGSKLTLNTICLDSDFTGNSFADHIIIRESTTLNGVINLRDGDNIITANAETTFGNVLKTGKGNDSLTFFDVDFEDELDLGDGDNNLSATGIAKFSKSLNTGSGNDIFSFKSVEFNDIINLGSGSNLFTISELGKLQTIVTGSGNDVLTFYGTNTISEEINLGEGINIVNVHGTLTANSIRISQNGKTSISVLYGSTLKNNTLRVYSDPKATRESITLNWSNQTDLDKVRILVSSDSSFENYEFAVELYNQSKSFSLDLQQGYFIQFQAQDEDGWKQRLLDDTVAPNQVTGVSFKGSTLVWDETHDNLGGNGVKQYHVEVASDASFSTILQSGIVTTPKFALASNSEGLLYVRVRAEDYTDNIGAWSETFSGVFDNTPPSIPDNGNAAINGYSATMSWSAATDNGSGVSYYEYRVATDSTFGQIVTSGTTEACTVTVENLKYGTYYWQVRATDAFGNIGEWSLSKSFVPVDAIAPGTPTNLDFSIKNEVSLSVIWDAVIDDSLGSGLKGYEIQLANDSAFSSVVKTVSVTATEAIINNLSNATYYMRACAVDNARNKSDWTKAVSFTIDRDTTLPTVTNIQADVIKPTNGNVTITASFNDNAAVASSLYRIGENGQWTDYVDGVTVFDNLTVYFKAIDTSGNESAEVSYKVSNIDKTLPTVTNVKATITTPTTQKVKVTAAFSDNVALASSQYKIGENGTWKTYSGGVTLSENGTVYFKAIDTARNESEIVSYTVSNIDKTSPTTPSGLQAVVVDQAVTLSWIASSDDLAGVKEYIVKYSHDGQEFTRTITETSLLLENIDFATWQWNVQAVDNVGNLSEVIAGNEFIVEPAVSPEPEPATQKKFFVGCFSGGIQAMLAVQTDRTVTIYADDDTWGYDLKLDPGWKIAGTGDFNVDGRDDFLRINDEGYVVGEMTKLNGKFVPQVLNLKGTGWSILGTGDFNGNGSDDVLIANPTAASETVGLLGYWESGVTWTLINGYSAEWEMIATGDFNADGKCDMLWRNSFVGEGGLTYNAFCTWVVENQVDWRMVSVANPAEWNFLCAGDFDGNGSHDIAMVNGEGVVGIWGVEDGWLSSWSILSAVNPSEWTLAGVGDFNADGTDDIAWYNESTGLAGYWQIENKKLASWQNIATIS